MSLAPGTRLGPYEIIAAIGAGGMGEVYRARDTKLKREVALKILPDAFALDAERMARFEREACVLAALNHPNIAHIYSVEERALVMELVEGETLSSPLPLETALNYARQIAQALEYAHEKGVIHRDLKPANIKVTPEGVVKLLDFGLAKAIEDPAVPADDPSVSPTLTLGATRVGMIMGTAAYMSPEQASGKTADRRADIWSFGAVLYEMLAGKKAFEGESVSDTLASVLKLDPDWDALPAATPASIPKLVRRCLTKDRKQRLQAIGEARITLESPSAEESAPVTAPSRSRLNWVAWGIAGLAVACALALGFMTYRYASERRVLKVFVLPPEKATFRRDSVPAVSPDGRSVAFAANADGKISLWVRDLDSLAARPLAGTEGASDPFWSPDSRFLGFFAGGKLKRIDPVGGPAVTLCDAANARGGSWSNVGVIVFTPTLAGGLFRVPEGGGSAVPITGPNQALGENSHRWPWFLPDGRHFLYTAWNSDSEKSAVYIADLDSKDRRRVLSANSNAVYAPPGYLLFMRERTLMAQPFSAAKTQTTGDPFPVAEQVDYIDVQIQGQFSCSRNGVLAYTSGALVGERSEQLTWFDRSGKALGTVGSAGSLDGPAISPDGSIVAVSRQDPQTGVRNLWLHDLTRGSASRFTFGRQDLFPIWSPDGSQIAFGSVRGGVPMLYQKATSTVAQEEVLDKTHGAVPQDWSRDGRYIIEVVNDPKTKNDIWVLPLFGNRKPFPYLQADFNESFARLSPNGRWLAYQSDETKRNEVYVMEFPAPRGKLQISTNGGDRPVWSRDGRELFFVAADGRMMAVETASDSSKLKAGAPKPLFDARIGGLRIGGPFLRYDVSKDGRFLIPTQTEQAAGVPMTVVVNWTVGLKK